MHATVVVTAVRHQNGFEERRRTVGTETLVVKNCAAVVGRRNAPLDLHVHVDNLHYEIHAHDSRPPSPLGVPIVDSASPQYACKVPGRHQPLFLSASQCTTTTQTVPHPAVPLPPVTCRFRKFLMCGE